MAKTGWRFPVLADERAETIRRYGILHPGAGPEGKDITRPAEFLLDPKGIVRWRDLTDDFRVRTRPETVLQEIDRLQAKKAP